MNLDRLDAEAIAELRRLEREGTINKQEVRLLLGFAPYPEVTVQLRVDSSPLKEAIQFIRLDVERMIRDIERRGVGRR